MASKSLFGTTTGGTVKDSDIMAYKEEDTGDEGTRNQLFSVMQTYFQGTLPDSVATNVTDIATNVTDIATNVTDIATNVTDIATNVTDIATNVTNIATNTTDIATNVTDIATNVTNIATNVTDIATNVTDIATNTTGIATNVTGIATNVTNITTNTTGIADLVTDVAAISGIERLTTLDISTADKTTDLDQYLTAGTDPQTDGYQILVTWSGGDATYSHCFTSTYNLKNQFVDKAVGDNSTTYAWCGYGTGGLLLEKDEANSCWHVLTDGCFDKGTGTNGDIWGRYTDFTAKETILISGTASTSAGGAWWYSYAWTYVIPLSSYSCFSATGSNYAIGSTSSISATLMTGKLGRMDGTDVSVSGCLSVCGVLPD